MTDGYAAPARSTFEGSYLGDDAGLSADARMECGICWTVYDPAVGDPVSQAAPGTAFSELPGDWRCPTCDAPKTKFMVLADGQTPTKADPLRARVAQLVAAYREIEMIVRSLPVYNARLTIESVGFRAHQDMLVGVLSTPWFMNIVAAPLSPAQAAPRAKGSKRFIAFPSGDYEFVAGELKGFGGVELCSLFSPMDAFENQQAARIAAEAAATELFTAPEPEQPAAPEPVSRRALFMRQPQAAE
jgi:[NiFe] hydrogenase assembly HybE family chaperone